jgi:hypothetical protein
MQLGSYAMRFPVMLSQVSTLVLPPNHVLAHVTAAAIHCNSYHCTQQAFLMMASYALALCLHKPEQFGLLVGASLSAIVGSALFFTRHVLRHVSTSATVCDSPPAVQLKTTSAGYAKLATQQQQQQQQRTPTSARSNTANVHSPLKQFQFGSPNRWGQSHSSELQQQQQYTAL